MKFVLVDPYETKVEMIDARNLLEAYTRAGLTNTSEFGVDHGMLAADAAIVVDGASLLIAPSTQRYFQIGDDLYGGKAIIYGVGAGGKTVDVPHKPSVLFFANAKAVERAINDGQVRRPQTLINGKLVWEWKADA